ncbi:MAG: hypothetical protein SCJ97_08545 [Bacillota bacterium]|nr:hypothetical protein [Bacillota bacterium]
MNIDIHTHYLPQEFIDLVKKDPVKYQARIEKNDLGEEIIYHDQGYSYPLYPGFYDLEARLRDMDARNIDLDILSIAPTLYYYWAENSLALEIAKICNDSVYRMVQQKPERLKAMATVPNNNALGTCP